MPHVVLLGDSIFDNAAYVGGGPDVIAQLREVLPPDTRATLVAVDGAVVEDVHRQVEHLPPDATHLVLSVGGNDALGHVDLLDIRVSSSAQALSALADAAEAFERRYVELLDRILATALPTAVCTVYFPNFEEPELQRVASTALAVFNDVILRAAFARALPVIDLRLVCDSRADYANEIEPSVRGGAKIVAAIARLLEGGPACSRVVT